MRDVKWYMSYIDKKIGLMADLSLYYSFNNNYA